MMLSPICIAACFYCKNFSNKFPSMTASNLASWASEAHAVLAHDQIDLVYWQDAAYGVCDIRILSNLVKSWSVWQLYVPKLWSFFSCYLLSLLWIPESEIYLGSEMTFNKWHCSTFWRMGEISPSSSKSSRAFGKQERALCAVHGSSYWIIDQTSRPDFITPKIQPWYSW